MVKGMFRMSKKKIDIESIILIIGIIIFSIGFFGLVCKILPTISVTLTILGLIFYFRATWEMSKEGKYS